MISTILIPTDGSKTSQQAAKYTVGLAKQLKASVIVLSVIDHRSIRKSLPRGTPVHLIEPIEDQLRETAEGHAGEIRKWCDESGVRSKTLTPIGDPAEEIIKEARRSNTDLIVMASHKSNALAPALLGGVADCLIHTGADIPVLLVRRNEA